MSVLKAFCKEVEKENPFGLVLKGGTALALSHFNHRESEDLDFDVDIRLREDYQKLESYFTHIFDGLQQRKLIVEYRITKSDFAATNRFHLKVELKTAKTYYSKIDLDFIELPSIIEKRGELKLYPLERMFIGKSLAFVNRKEFKDLYDLAYLAPKIAVEKIVKKKEVAELLQRVIDTAQAQDIKIMFKLAFRNVDLKFKDMKGSKIEEFVAATIHKIRKVIRTLQR